MAVWYSLPNFQKIPIGKKRLEEEEEKAPNTEDAGTNPFAN